MARIIGSVTQGSADAFAEAEIQTGLNGVSDRAYQVRRIIYELPALTSNSDIELSVTRRTKAAMPNISASDLIDKIKLRSVLATSGGYQNQVVQEHLFAQELNLLIAEDPIYFQIDSTGTSASNTGLVVIEYEIVAISVADRLALLQATIADL